MKVQIITFYHSTLVKTKSSQGKTIKMPTNLPDFDIIKLVRLKSLFFIYFALP